MVQDGLVGIRGQLPDERVARGVPDLGDQCEDLAVRGPQQIGELALVLLAARQRRFDVDSGKNWDSRRIDLDSDAEIVALLVFKPKEQLLLAASNGRGFAAEIDELLAETRKGRGVVSVKPGVKLAVVREIAPEHDHVAVVGDNRKLVVFSLEELPVMSRGQGVTLQRYRDGGLADATTLKLEDGLSWGMGGDTGRVRTEKDIQMWKVARGAAGRLPPQGFPRDNKF